MKVTESLKKLWRGLCLTSCLLLLGIPMPQAGAQNPACAQDWPEWIQFKQRFITADGRVIDHSGANKPTVSEGQAYAMMFALVADDKDSFRQLLTWTENNLAAGDLTVRLPAWQWGQRPDQSWGVIDTNSASDADLWIAYVLAMASERWKEPRFGALSRLLAQRILKEETANIPGLGLTLLPAPQGFQNADQSWKLNPSYLPIPLLRWFASNSKDERWNQLITSTLKIVRGASPSGYAADWILYSPQTQAFSPDLQGPEHGEGGYNAIRVYLWAGMMPESDPARAGLLKQLQPMANLVAQLGYPPEFVNILSGTSRGAGSTGFSSALLPFLKSVKAREAFQQQTLRISAQNIAPERYYDQVLNLFSSAWLDKRYQFTANGNLQLKNKTGCHAR